MIRHKTVLNVLGIYYMYHRVKEQTLMGFIHEKLISINLGIAKPYTLMQLTDVHVVNYDEKDDNQSIKKAIQQEHIWMKQRLDFAHKFNEDFDLDSLFPSTKCLMNLIEYTNDQHPDLVLLTGDFVDYYSPSNYKFVKNALKMLHSPYIFSCGNHEQPASLFNDFCQGHCEFNVVEFDEFLVVSIDNSTRKINDLQLNMFNNILNLNKPVILAMHIPIMTDYNFLEFKTLEAYYTMSYQDSDEVTRSFIDILCTSKHVKAIFCGHVHGTIKSLVSKHIPQYCCSSGLIGSIHKIIIK